MSISVPLQGNAVDTADLEKLAKSNPQYTRLFLALTQIDAFIKQVAKYAVCTHSNPDTYSIKTEISATAYSLYLHNAERDAIVGTTWPIGTFIQMCQSKTIGLDVTHKVNTMLDRCGDIDLQTGMNVNWI